MGVVVEKLIYGCAREHGQHHNVRVIIEKASRKNRTCAAAMKNIRCASHAFYIVPAYELELLRTERLNGAALVTIRAKGTLQHRICTRTESDWHTRRLTSQKFLSHGCYIILEKSRYSS